MVSALFVHLGYSDDILHGAKQEYEVRWRGDMMIIDQKILDDLTAQAKASPRLRMNLDLRNSPEDG